MAIRFAVDDDRNVSSIAGRVNKISNFVYCQPCLMSRKR